MLLGVAVEGGDPLPRVGVAVNGNVSRPEWVADTVAGATKTGPIAGVVALRIGQHRDERLWDSTVVLLQPIRDSVEVGIVHSVRDTVTVGVTVPWVRAEGLLAEIAEPVVVQVFGGVQETVTVRVSLVRVKGIQDLERVKESVTVRVDARRTCRRCSRGQRRIEGRAARCQSHGTSECRKTHTGSGTRRPADQGRRGEPRQLVDPPGRRPTGTSADDRQFSRGAPRTTAPGRKARPSGTPR